MIYSRWILYLPLILLLLTLLIWSANGLPEKATPCIYCHDKLGVGFADEIDECGGCHDMNPPTHNPRTCDNCHKITDTNSYHQVHNISCTTCHADGRKPEGSTLSACASCHKPIHEIHTQCIDCHGEAIYPKQIPKNFTGKSLTNYTITSFLYSIYQLLNNGFKAITWI
jgi:hypothetical protein